MNFSFSHPRFKIEKKKKTAILGSTFGKKQAGGGWSGFFFFFNSDVGLFLLYFTYRY
jgi:hypothetical protein